MRVVLALSTLNASVTRFSSSVHSTPKEDKFSALVITVLTTATLCAVGWCDLNDRYRLVWVALR